MLEVPEIEFIEMRCKNCKYWGKSKNDNFGPCRSGFIYYDSRAGDTNMDESELNCLLYSDEEGYRANHITGPEFGCVHFKLKEEN